MESLPEKFRAAPVTVILAAACVAVFAAEYFLLVTERPQLLGLLALSGEGLARGWWWTPVTHLFVHANLLHLAVNVAGLWFMGPEVETMLGRARYVVLYLASGVAGGLLQTAFSSPQSELVGASGSVCGILLCFTTAYPEAPLRALLFFIIPVRMKAKTLGRGLIVFSLACAVLRLFPQLGHLAHLGGALTGALLTKLWLPSIPRPSPLASMSAQDRAAEADDLLRRLSEEGIESLTREEQQRLARLGEDPRPRGGGRW
ncbi:MAG: rhomboid family intramembrane serine protease [Chthoniobacterales bacterium]|nr:rhomboid family intramembrane serine protease [Chthoniobacterales bacterium]